MKKIGMVGGIAWLSTAEYYMELCRRSEERHIARKDPGLPGTPEMSIESLDLNRAFSLVGDDEDGASWAGFEEYHRAALMRVEQSGADFAVIASNTPHIRWAEITRGIRIPVLSIIDAVARECAGIGAREMLILGTKPTMKAARFREGFFKHGIAAAGPRDETGLSETAELIHGLQRGKTAGAAGRVEEIARGAFGQFGGQPAVALCCTELPLAFPEEKVKTTFQRNGITYLNSTLIHIQAAFEFAIAE